MNLVNALKRHRPYKRRSWYSYVEPNQLPVYLTHIDCIATDWEVKETKEWRLISEEMLARWFKLDEATLKAVWQDCERIPEQE